MDVELTKACRAGDGLSRPNRNDRCCNGKWLLRENNALRNIHPYLPVDDDNIAQILLLRGAASREAKPKFSCHIQAKLVSRGCDVAEGAMDMTSHGLAVCWHLDHRNRILHREAASKEREADDIVFIGDVWQAGLHKGQLECLTRCNGIREC